MTFHQRQRDRERGYNHRRQQRQHWRRKQAEEEKERRKQQQEEEDLYELMEASMAYHRTKDEQAFVDFCNKQAKEQAK